jgi:D-lactate dehydrogenase (cytochrome)
VRRPRSVEEVSACLQQGGRLLPVGAQSSLTGGATPMGDVVLSTERLTALELSGDRIRVAAGVPLQVLQDHLAATGRWFPPVPTFLGATAGGAAATCAAGAATFKYGTVREWVEGLTIVLAGGDILELTRGECQASPEGTFTIDTASGPRVVRLPAIRMPDVPKRAAGYFLAPGMDLIDLFIGSEGTLGVIAEAVFRTAPLPAGTCRALVPVPNEALAIAVAGELRSAAQETWRWRDPLGIDIAAIEHIDARAIALLREDGIDRTLNIRLPPDTAVALLIDFELSSAAGDLWRQLETVRDADTGDAPLVRFCRRLDRHGLLDDTEIALPNNRSRAQQLAEFREAVPAAVNSRIAAAHHESAAMTKTAADMIVPFDRFAEMMTACRRLFTERELDLVVWGHISDGNVHPNVLPRRPEDVTRGQEAILALGDEVIAMGGCPLAEHGVGRNPIKQELLWRLYGSAGIDGMRALKLSLDPNGSLANGVIFPAQ